MLFRSDVAEAMRNTTAGMAAKWSKYVSGVPGLDAGGRVLSRGRVLVGERKPELLDLPTGATVTPLSKAAGGYGTANVYLEMDGRRVAAVMGVHLTDLIRLKTGIK